MAIPLNEEIREEARKMSEYVVEDTKRTVEMLNWLKGKQSGEATNAVGDALKIGAALSTGNILKGASMLSDMILPRLRDRVADPIADLPKLPNEASMELITLANDKVSELRAMISEKEINAHDVDDICYDIQVILADVFKAL